MSVLLSITALLSAQWDHIPALKTLGAEQEMEKRLMGCALKMQHNSLLPGEKENCSQFSLQC